MADYAIHDTTLYGISNVIRKKDGTSALIDPADYEDRINLMGMLEEKTVSGSVVAFSDGADAVKLKSCEVTIAPTLDGISSVDVVQTGKNLLNPTLYDGGAYNPTVDSQCTFTESATQFSHVGNTYSVTFSAKWTTYTMLVPVKYGVSYYTKFSLSGTGTNLGTSVYCVDSDGKVLASAINSTSNPQTRTFAVNVPSGAKYFCIAFTNRSTAETTLTFTEPQLEVGSSSSTYAPYVTPTTHTANLGRTIYGGSVDVVNGTGTETNGLQTFDGTEVWTLSGTTFWYTSKPKENVKASHICTTSNNVVIRYSTNGQIRCYISDNQGVVDTNTNMNTLLSNGVSFNYQLNDNVDFTFEPISINSRLGDNTMWGDGDLSVTYRSSGTIHQYAEGEEVYF